MSIQLARLSTKPMGSRRCCKLTTTTSLFAKRSFLRQPVDFFSPDTFNYATLDISADGKTLSVNLYGINSYAADTFPSEQQVSPVRRLLGFQIKAASV
jgi:hypothetical protein